MSVILNLRLTFEDDPKIFEGPMATEFEFGRYLHRTLKKFLILYLSDATCVFNAEEFRVAHDVKPHNRKRSGAFKIDRNGIVLALWNFQE